MKIWNKTKVTLGTTIKETLRIINESALQIALVVDEYDKLLGVVTDGDIRRAILRSESLEKSVSEIMIRDPITINGEMSRRDILAKFKKNQLNCIPVVDKNNIVIGVKSLQDLALPQFRENPVILMVGGLGTRLQPLTEQCPKPLLKVGDKPILETILGNFIECGFNSFYFAVNYKANMIKDHFGDGSRFGVNISYLYESKRMGTAGALGLLDKKIELPAIVMNGDILAKIDFAEFLDYHQKKNALATMAVREYTYQIPYGVIDFEKGKITDIREKPKQTFFVNAGIYVLNPEAIEKVQPNQFFDMPDLFNKIIADGGDTAAFPVYDYWLDIGQFDDFKRAQKDFKGIFKREEEL